MAPHSATPNAATPKSATRRLEALGYRVINAVDGIRLQLDNHILNLGCNPDWESAVKQANAWLDDLTEQAGRRGRDLIQRRKALGHADLDAFCELTGLAREQTFEAEAGMDAPLPVHLRILDWLESGKLTLDGSA